LSWVHERDEIFNTISIIKLYDAIFGPVSFYHENIDGYTHYEIECGRILLFLDLMSIAREDS